MRSRLLMMVLLTCMSGAAFGDTTDAALGPVAAWRGHTIVNDAGVQADAPAVLPVPGPTWSPQWFTAAGATPTSTLYLSRMLDVAAHGVLQTAMIRSSGDRSYRLWVNGTLVLRGPDDVGSDVGEAGHWTHQWLYNTVDIAPYLHTGHNAIAVEIVNTPSSSAFSLGQTGFAFDASLAYADGSHQDITGPAGWVGVAMHTYDEGKLSGAPGLDGVRFHGAIQPDGWPTSNDTHRWPAVQDIPSVWGALQSTRILQRMEAIWPAVGLTDVKGALARDAGALSSDMGMTATGDGQFTVRFDRVISAYLALEVDADDDATLTLIPRETADQDEIARPLELTLRKGHTSWESPGYDAFSQVEVRLTHVTKPVHIRFVRAVFTSQPVVYRGSFESSDNHLNALWRAARWQTQLCLQDRFLDSPNHQEPIGDPGDYLIAAAQSDYAFGEPYMAAQNLRQFAALLDRNDEVTFHASYPLFWVQMLVQYYQATGDRQLVRELVPSVDRFLVHLRTYLGPNGLLSEAPNYMFMDWVKLQGYNLHHPPAVIGQGYFSALYYRGLTDGAQLARLVGDEQKAAGYDAQAATLREAFDRELWDARAGLYRDGRPFLNHRPLVHYLPADKAIETHTDQVNLMAALYGLAAPARARAIVGTLGQRDRLNVQPYFMHFAFDAEAATGQWDALAWRQLKQWYLNPETRTFQEMWNHGDWSHSWGGTPLIQLSSRVLGVTPAAPGYAKVRIAPHPLALDWAKGSVPTPRGLVTVSWKRGADGAVEVNVASPDGMPLVFDRTGFDEATGPLSVDGVEVQGNTAMGIELAGGEHVMRIGAGKPQEH